MYIYIYYYGILCFIILFILYYIIFYYIILYLCIHIMIITIIWFDTTSNVWYLPTMGGLTSKSLDFYRPRTFFLEEHQTHRRQQKTLHNLVSLKPSIKIMWAALSLVKNWIPRSWRQSWQSPATLVIYWEWSPILHQASFISHIHLYTNILMDWTIYGGFHKWGYPCSSSISRWDFLL